MNVFGPGAGPARGLHRRHPDHAQQDRGGRDAVHQTGTETQAYDFIYVEDVARCNVLAATSPAQLGFYNVGTEVQTTIRELCDLILLKGSSLKVVYKPYSEDDARQFVKNRIGSRRLAVGGISGSGTASRWKTACSS